MFSASRDVLYASAALHEANDWPWHRGDLVDRSTKLALLTTAPAVNDAMFSGKSERMIKSTSHVAHLMLR